MSNSDSATHDVFISYSRANTDWVVEELQPQLECAGLTVLRDEESFQVGQPLPNNLVAAVKNSRHMVAVVTEQWLESPWCQQEAELQLAKDPDGSESRLFALVSVTHDKLPAQLKNVVYANCRTSETLGKAISRVLLHLGISQAKIEETNALFAEKGIAHLRQLLSLPQVTADIQGYTAVLGDLGSEIKRLGQYKNLHDLFQKAEGDYELFFSTVQLVKLGGRQWSDLNNPAELMTDYLEQVCVLAAKYLPKSEKSWSGKLKVSLESLAAAIQQEKFDLLKKPMEKLRQVFGEVPTALNGQMIAIAGALNLPKLIEILAKIRTELLMVNFDQNADAALTGFRQGITAFRVLEIRLTTLKDQHNVMQSIDTELRRYDFLKGITSLPEEEIIDTCQFLKDYVVTLAGDDDDAPRANWLTALLNVADKLSEKCIPAGGPTLNEESRAAIRKQFSGLHNKHKIGATAVDTDLKNLCERLQRVGEELGGFLGEMKNG